jgi:hypothetical protein
VKYNFFEFVGYGVKGYIDLLYLDD